MNRTAIARVLAVLAAASLAVAFAARRINDRFSIFVPTGRAISPVTGTNWEGTGVVPDVEIPAGEALERAVELARAATRAS